MFVFGGRLFHVVAAALPAKLSEPLAAAAVINNVGYSKRDE
jgi:hypothetical protein